MSVALRVPAMTRDEFLDWAERQEERYEFDGFRPVRMAGGTVDHGNIAPNIHMALRSRLRGTGCRSFGPDAGIATVGEAVRSPDALVTCAEVPGKAKLVPDPVVVFEVLSPTSEHMDHVVKPREYQAVPSIRRYVIVEQDTAGLVVMHRAGPDAGWEATTLLAGETLALPEIGAEVPVDEFYEGVALSSGVDGTEKEA